MLLSEVEDEVGWWPIGGGAERCISRIREAGCGRLLRYLLRFVLSDVEVDVELSLTS